MITRRQFLARGAGGIAAAGVFGALSEEAFAAAARLGATKATFQLGWIANVENMGEFIGDERGYYTGEGLDLKIVPGGPGVSVEPLVVSGKALVGLSSADYTARARLQGAKLKIVGTTLQKNPSAVMSLAKNPIHTPHDLVGKKLGLQQTSYATYNAFFKAGPDLNYSFSGFPFGGGGFRFPTYSVLMTETDTNNQHRSYLATEENYRIVADMEKRNAIVPVTGDFAGPKALRSVGRYLKSHEATVTRRFSCGSSCGPRSSPMTSSA